MIGCGGDINQSDSVGLHRSTRVSLSLCGSMQVYVGLCGSTLVYAGDFY